MTDTVAQPGLATALVAAEPELPKVPKNEAIVRLATGHESTKTIPQSKFEQVLGAIRDALEMPAPRTCAKSYLRWLERR